MGCSVDGTWFGYYLCFDRIYCRWCLCRNRICSDLPALRVFSGQFDVLLLSLGHPGGLVCLFLSLLLVVFFNVSGAELYRCLRVVMYYIQRSSK